MNGRINQGKMRRDGRRERKSEVEVEESGGEGTIFWSNYG